MRNRGCATAAILAVLVLCGTAAWMLFAPVRQGGAKTSVSRKAAALRSRRAQPLCRSRHKVLCRTKHSGFLPA